MFALVDCNNFYVSCERVFNPSLNGKPVAVLSNNDGCIIARSNEVKAMGIPMGAPVFEYRDIIEKNNVILYSSNYTLYDDMSRRVMSILTEHCPDVEVYSIDESFIDFSSLQKVKDVYAYAVCLQQTVFRMVGIPVSIGLAPTKTLAKAANKYAKKNIKDVPVFMADTPEKIRALLEWLPVEDVWGIGSRYARRLQSMGIKTAYGFTLLPDEWVRKHMTIRGLAMKRELCGQKIWILEGGPPHKSVATTRSFEQMIGDFDALRERISAFCENVGWKLRRYRKKTRELLVFIRTNPFRENLPQYYNSILIPLPVPSHSTLHLTCYAVAGLRKIYKDGYLYKKAGVVALGLQDENIFQYTFFDDREEHARHDSLMKCIDGIRSRFGRGSVHVASQVGPLTHRMKQERISPCYTTRWEDLLTVNAG
ncbi:MAG: Y-family DNA polymerase [Bacteroidia bacterium]|nr:Y-family DNA polymerase [Bacteroidia bacterium]